MCEILSTITNRHAYNSFFIIRNDLRLSVRRMIPEFRFDRR